MPEAISGNDTEDHAGDRREGRESGGTNGGTEAANERTPLVAKDPKLKKMDKGLLTPYRRMLMVALVLSFAFGCTQTPLVYAYRTFTCEEYYKNHPPYQGKGDRCAIHEIEKQTARALSVMVTLTTVSGVLNLLTTGWLMRNYGVRAALINQTAWPVLRNMCQITGMIIGGNVGILLFQVTQTITALGGGAGYLLAANSFVAAVVEPEERTACFGQLQGVAMLGTACAFTVGGVLGDVFGQVVPFAFTLGLLVFSTLLSRFALPYIPPEQTESKGKDGKVGSKGFVGGIKSFFKPLKVFKPRKLETLKNKTYYGVTLLGMGNFTSVLATAYVPIMLQLISTNLYGFRPSQIIKLGRKWYNTSHGDDHDLKDETNGKAIQEFQEEIRQEWDDEGGDSSTEPTPLIDGEDSTSVASSSSSSTKNITDVSRKANHHSAFDLVFLRMSILVDAVLTSCVALSSKGWHMYLAAAIIPLASGTAPASKGVVMEMVTAEQRPDALSAVSLVELTATVTTTSVFGAIFAYLSDVGKPNIVFMLNGAIAFISACILMFVRLPPKEQTTIDNHS